MPVKANHGRNKIETDPAKPYTGRWGPYEAFCQELTDLTIDQTTAYLKAFPGSAKWKRQTVSEKASRLASKCAARISHLRERAASARVMSVVRRKEILSRIAEEIGAHDPADYVEAGADGVYITFGKDSPNRKAVAGIKSRTEMAAEGSGKNDAVITELRLRSHSEAAEAIKELNAMEGLYPDKRYRVDVTSDGKPLSAVIAEAEKVCDEMRAKAKKKKAKG